MPTEGWSPYSTVVLRVALGATFLTAVTDRFGVWGAPGAPQVAWGDFAHFLRYAAQVNAFLPPALIPPSPGSRPSWRRCWAWPWWSACRPAWPPWPAVGC
jgi:hypothetical protein